MLRLSFIKSSWQLFCKSAWETTFPVVCLFDRLIWGLRLLICTCLWTLIFSNRCRYVLLWQHVGSLQRKAKDVSMNVGACVCIWPRVMFSSKMTQNDQELISSADTGESGVGYLPLYLAFPSFSQFWLSEISGGIWCRLFIPLPHTTAWAKPWQRIFLAKWNEFQIESNCERSLNQRWNM